MSGARLPHMALTDRLRKARVAAGLSQRAAAKKLGIAAASLAQWEIGRTRPDLGRMAEVAALYGVDLRELMIDEARSVEHEADILRLYRQLSPEGRRSLLAFLLNIAA